MIAQKKIFQKLLIYIKPFNTNGKDVINLTGVHLTDL